jgi:hypothetical protein
MSSGSSLVLTMMLMGRGARGLVVVGSSSELLHHWQPDTTPTHDLSGIGDAVTRRDRSRTTASVLSAIAIAPESTSSTPSLPTEAVMLAPAPEIRKMLPRTGRTRRLPVALGGCCAATGSSADTEATAIAAAAASSADRSVIRTPARRPASCRPWTSCRAPASS